jgi:hypothetical protein
MLNRVICIVVLVCFFFISCHNSRSDFYEQCCLCVLKSTNDFPVESGSSKTFLISLIQIKLDSSHTKLSSMKYSTLIFGAACKYTQTCIGRATQILSCVVCMSSKCLPLCRQAPFHNKRWSTMIESFSFIITMVSHGDHGNKC